MCFVWEKDISYSGGAEQDTGTLGPENFGARELWGQGTLGPGNFGAIVYMSIPLENTS